jgi:hypothetical protein
MINTIALWCLTCLMAGILACLLGGLINGFARYGSTTLGDMLMTLGILLILGAVIVLCGCATAHLALVAWRAT